jgi:Na+/melibiose symporter-like transporter
MEREDPWCKTTSLRVCVYMFLCLFTGWIAVGVSFPFVFTQCVFDCQNASSWAQFVYYAPFVAIFQFGWAAAQIAHMALMSELSTSPSEKTELSGIRLVSCRWRNKNKCLQLYILN